MTFWVGACSSSQNLANWEVTSSACSHNKAMNLTFANNIIFTLPLSCTLADIPTCFCLLSQFYSSFFPSSSYPASVWPAFRLERVAAGDKFPFSPSISRLSEPVRMYSPHTVIWIVLLFLTTWPMPAMQVYVPLSHFEAFLVKFWACDTITPSFWMVKLTGGAPGMEHHRFSLSSWSRLVAEDSSFGLENSSEKPVSGNGVKYFWAPLPKPPYRVLWPSCFWQNQMPSTCIKLSFASQIPDGHTIRELGCILCLGFQRQVCLSCSSHLFHRHGLERFCKLY